MGNEVLRCRTCGEMFVFTAEEQNYYAKRCLQTPHHCKKCRQARKMKPDPYEGWQSTMGGYMPAKRGHRRVQYSGAIWAGGVSQ